MRNRVITAIAMCAIAVVMLPNTVGIQPVKASTYPYVLIDIGTLGGPSDVYYPPVAHPVTASGVVVGGAANISRFDGNYPNHNPFNASDPYMEHAYTWKAGHMTDLTPTLTGNDTACTNSSKLSVLPCDIVTNVSDPLTGWPEMRAAVYAHRKFHRIGVLPRGNESVSEFSNNKGLVAGWSTNGTTDPYNLGSVFCCGDTKNQMRTFMWQHGSKLYDIGTLGGPDAQAFASNGAGQLAGNSYTNGTPTLETGLPRIDAFRWTKAHKHGSGHMLDIAGLGGVFTEVGNDYAGAMNEKGQVAGDSDLAGDNAWHPFMWDGSRTYDLGTLGGVAGYEKSEGINANGDVTGSSDVANDSTHDGFLWTKAGGMVDLPGTDGNPCSNGFSINDSDVVVGDTSDCHGTAGVAMLWQGGSAYDLNTMIAPSAMRLSKANYINDNGYIFGTGVLPGGQQRTFLLVPTDLAAKTGLTSNVPAISAAQQRATTWPRISVPCGHQASGRLSASLSQTTRRFLSRRGTC